MLIVTAVHTFTAEHGDELEFQAGEKIEVLEKDDAFGDGWYRVRYFRRAAKRGGKKRADGGWRMADG